MSHNNSNNTVKASIAQCWSFLGVRKLCVCVSVCLCAAGRPSQACPAQGNRLILFYLFLFIVFIYFLMP